MYPPIWAQSRQEICEGFDWFRSYQGGVYYANNVVRGYLLSAFASLRDRFDHGGRVIISHGGGKAESLHCHRGQIATQQADDQLAEDKSVRALLSNYHEGRPLVLIIDDKYTLFPYDLGAKDVTYAVLGLYTITSAWGNFVQNLRWQSELKSVQRNINQQIMTVVEWSATNSRFDGVRAREDLGGFQRRLSFLPMLDLHPHDSAPRRGDYQPRFQFSYLWDVMRGPLLTNYFSHNTGEPYQYVGGTENTVPWGAAPSAVIKARQYIESRIRGALKIPIRFNEVLSAAYMERQRMAFHSDAEQGLGPVVAGLSLGSPAIMHFRPHIKYETDREHRNVVLSFVLRHGDILVMDGAQVQECYEHMVVPTNFRIAATARWIQPGATVSDISSIVP
ncbi:hypothetical protein AX16_005213 [Volvariella volvacea WC 439]|nr:hypothetical protein AX16_005213 [Volvariella volvacea WC 439]